MQVSLDSRRRCVARCLVVDRVSEGVRVVSDVGNCRKAPGEHGWRFVAAAMTVAVPWATMDKGILRMIRYFRYTVLLTFGVLGPHRARASVRRTLRRRPRRRRGPARLLLAGARLRRAVRALLREKAGRSLTVAVRIETATAPSCRGADRNGDRSILSRYGSKRRPLHSVAALIETAPLRHRDRAHVNSNRQLAFGIGQSTIVNRESVSRRGRRGAR